MKTTVWLALLCLGLLPPSAEEKNLVLKRPYSHFPKSNYPHCTDEGDATQLTDGVTKYKDGDGRIWMQKSCVGWQGIDEGLVILFDLGETAALSELRFNTTGGGAADVHYPDLQVYVSLDDRSYILAAMPSPPPVPSEGNQVTQGRQMEVPLKEVKARYVALAAKPPRPYHYLFVDEIEIIGRIPATTKPKPPTLPAISASGAKELQESLAARGHTGYLIESLSGPIKRHTACWPKAVAAAQSEDLKEFRRRAVTESGGYEALRAQFTQRHRVRASKVYDVETLVWEVIPDEQFTMLSLPEVLAPPQRASIHTVINALEATALGAANLTEKGLRLSVAVSSSTPGAPAVTPRIARFFVTANGKHVPDALLADDCPQVIPSGESRLVWLGAESREALPGKYEYEATVKIGDQAHLIPLQVQVHNVTLSPKTPLATGNWAYLDRLEKPFDREVRDSMLDHRMTIGAASAAGCPWPKIDEMGNMLQPMELDFASLDKTLAFHKDFPQMSWYLPFNYAVRNEVSDRFGKPQWMTPEFKARFREWFARVVERIRASGRDYDGFYFQFMDETLDPKVGELCELAHSVDPQVRIMITSHSNASAGALQGLAQAGINIFVHQATRVGYDNAPSGYAVFSSGGRELHLYGAADRRTGIGRERDPLDFFRLMHWLAFHHKAAGVHFWNMVHDRHSGWLDHQTYYPFVYIVDPEDTHLPADVKTAERVIPSRRWECTRMGIEDYMLLKMAQEKLESMGRAGVSHQKQLHAIVKTVLTTRAKDRKLFRAKRRELVELVEKLAGQMRGR